MEKRFNITGICRPAKHYMADVSKKLGQTLKMIDYGEYFIINRPRQYGKTTTLYALADTLRKTGDYIVFNTSFEGLGDSFFENEKNLAQGFIKLLAGYAQNHAPSLEDVLHQKISEVDNLKTLSSVITEVVSKTDKRIVLLIDEVDKSSNNQLFVSFLGMLRNKYLAQDDFKTFHSVVLAGVHDVKSLKLKLRPEDEKKNNSPWNIAAEFKVDMNLQPFEIKPMLEEYCADRGVKMDTTYMSERLFYYTSGYPFLVSKLCKMLDEDILPTKETQEWTDKDLVLAVLQLTKQTNTNFESLISNLENNPLLYQMVNGMLVDSQYQSYSIHDPLISMGMMYGIFKNGNGTRIHNKIYEEVIYDYMTSKAKSHVFFTEYHVSKGFKLADNRLNMELVLLKFQAFMREHYSKKDRDFLEHNGRLVFLAFIKPIINGAGYDFKEVQISEERRLDVTITYFEHKYIAELKIWRGKAAHEEGLDQLTDYLDRLALSEGFLLIFDHNNVKTWHSEWTVWNDKKIFMAWV